MRWLLLAILLPAAGWAQSTVDPNTIPRLMNRFEPRTGEGQLACSVTPYGPALNFGFRLQAGYIVRIPMSQFTGPRHGWVILARVTPAGGDRKPVFLAMRTRLPDVPRTKAEVDIPGTYLLGEGSYDVRWMMLDDQGRVCRKSWRVEARLKRGERYARVAMRPYAIEPFSLLGSAGGPPAPDDRAPFRVTILMHAAPMFPRRTHFRASDRMLLIGSLAALLERLPARSVRLTVFNLDQQKELYRRDEFSLPDIDQVAQAMNDLELNAVDYRLLQKPTGHTDLLADLVNREAHAEKPSDAVVFLGPPTWHIDKLPHGAVEKPAGAPRFFYFQYRPFRRHDPSALPDTLAQTVSSLKGKISIIRTPADFAKAIDQLEKSAAQP